MSDNEEESVLSQNEINDLLADIGGDAPEESDELTTDVKDDDGPRIAIYDFLRPDFLSRDDVVRVTEIGRRVEQRISRLVPELSLSSVDVLTTDEFVRSVGSPCLAVPLAFDSSRRALLELSPRVARAVVRSALSVGAAASDDDQPLSDFEVAVAADAVSGRVSGAFPPFSVTSEAPVTEPEAIPSIGIGPMVCVVSFVAEISGVSGLASLLLDRFTVETLLLPRERPGISSRAAAESSPPNLVLREVLQFNLQGVTGGTLIEAIESGKIAVPVPPTATVTYRGE